MITISKKNHLVCFLLNADKDASEENPVTLDIKTSIKIKDKEFNAFPLSFEGDSPEEVIEKLALSASLVLGKAFNIKHQDILNKVKLT